MIKTRLYFNVTFNALLSKDTYLFTQASKQDISLS